MTISLLIPAPPIMFSPTELLAISHEISRRYSPIVAVEPQTADKPIAFTAMELFEISEEITKSHIPEINDKEPKLTLLPIDPEHLYVSCYLGASQPAPAANEPIKDTVLRIYPNAKQTSEETTIEVWFDAKVDPARLQQKILIPKEYQASTYTAILGSQDQSGHLSILATSNTTQTPVASYDVYQSGSRDALPLFVMQASFSSPGKQLNASNQMVNLGLR